MKKSLLACLMLFAALLALPLASLADAAPAVTITLDKQSVAVGETVTATYEISGEGEYPKIDWSWMVYTTTEDHEICQEISSDHVSALRGVCPVIPKYGERMYFEVQITDSNGRLYVYSSEEISVIGDTSLVPEIKIVLDREQVDIGETVTAVYEINGEGEYPKIDWRWMVYTTTEGHEICQEIASDHVSALTGNCPATPKYGERMYFEIHIMDSNGRLYVYTSEEILVNGDQSLEPEVRITLEGNTAAIGEPIRATYEVIGEGIYPKIDWNWMVYSQTDGNEICQEIASDHVSALSGTCSAVPRFGDRMYLEIQVTDDCGRLYVFSTEDIRISGFADNYDIYTVIEGADMQTSDGTRSLIFRADGAFEKYLGVQVDGKNVPDEHVTAWAGSTYVELSAEYLAALSAGEHELTIIFEDGVAATAFATTEKPVVDLPQTGDGSTPMVWLGLLGASSVMLHATHRRKKPNETKSDAE